MGFTQTIPNPNGVFGLPADSESLPSVDLTRVGVTTADDPAVAINAAIADAHARGGANLFLPHKTGGYVCKTPISFLNKQRVYLYGVGYEATGLRYNFTMGDVIDMTNSRFCGVGYMTISPSSSTPKLSDYLFDLTNSSNLFFDRLRMAGGYVLFRISSASDILWRDVRYTDPSTPLGPLKYGFYADTRDSSSLWWDNVSISTSQTFDATARGWALSGVDTFIMRQSGVQKINTAYLGGVLLDGTSWGKVAQCFFECGSYDVGAPAFDVQGNTRGTELNGTHLSTSRLGLLIHDDGTGKKPTGFKMFGGDISYNGQHGCLVEAGSARLIGVDISNNSKTTTGTYDGVHFAAGVSRFAVDDCFIGSYMTTVAGGGTKHRYGIYVEDGASDNYHLRSQYSDLTDFATGFMYDGGSGTHKVVTDY